jgi:hypothetical protein
MCVVCFSFVTDWLDQAFIGESRRTFFPFFFSVGHPGKPSSYVRFACMPRHDWFVGLTVVGSIVQSQSSLHLPMLVQVSFPLTG